VTVPSPIPLPPAAVASAGAALAAQFSQWEITGRPSGIWVAYWSSPDGRHRRVIAAGSAPELLTRLRAIGSMQ
jgi:hypothetical protein